MDNKTVNSNLKLSIITPNFNYAKFIGKTIESVLFQNYDNIEHIIVDDGSTDNSVEIIKKYQGMYPNVIRLIVQKNKGQSSAINIGLLKASGDIIGWINSDDTYCKNIFLDIVKIFNNNNIDVVYGNINVMDIDGNYTHSLKHFKFNYTESVFVGFGNNLSSNAVFWRKKIIDEIGLFNEDLKCNMDGDYFSRLTFGKRMYHLKKPIANFRVQVKTKAAFMNNNWEQLVINEIDQVSRIAYSKLIISKCIPYKYTYIIKLFFLVKKKFKKILFGYELIKKIEIIKYNINKQKQPKHPARN